MEEFESPKEKDKSKKEKKKKKKEGRSAETMFRTTLASHLQLSAMADQKAGLMISINSIIISVVITFLVSEVESSPRLLVPMTLLILVCLATITLALLSTRPSVRSKAQRSTLDKSKIDLLFFGDYLALSRSEYKEAMKQLIKDEEQVKETMIDNIYAQGFVIERKYRLLKITYLVFMIGFPLVLLSFLVVLFGA
jgi:hypothetical protein